MKLDNNKIARILMQYIADKVNKDNLTIETLQFYKDIALYRQYRIGWYGFADLSNETVIGASYDITCSEALYLGITEDKVLQELEFYVREYLAGRINTFITLEESVELTNKG